MTQLIDLQLQQTDGIYDISFDSNGEYNLVDSFDTTLIMAVFEERRADPSEVLISNLRRGWWGNVLQDTIGFENGSKIWLLYQARLTAKTRSDARDYISQGIQWMVDDGLIDSFEVSQVDFNTEKLTIKIDLFRNNSIVESRFFDVWESTPQ